MQIISLNAENIKRLKAIKLEISKDQKVITVSGANGQGKTSLLDSIFYALGGKSAIPEKPLREGTDKGFVEVDLEDMKVIRSFTKKGSTLKIIAKDGAKYTNPQAVLNGLLGKLSFDPLEFAKLDAKAQRKSLMDMLGLSTDELDTERKALYDRRTDVNRDLNRLRTTLESIPEPEGDVPKDFLVVSEIIKRLEDANQIKISHEENMRKRKIASDEVLRLKEHITQLQKDISEIDSKESGYEEPDMEGMKSELNQAEEKNSKIRITKRRGEIISEGIICKEAVEKIETRMGEIDASKASMLKDAIMPIEGLNVTDECVTFNDIPFEQLSSAEQLKISVAIAMAMNPDIRVIRIMDGSLLDSTNMKAIEDLAKDKDYQVWVEVVSDEEEMGIVIENGEVKKNNYSDES